MLTTCLARLAFLRLRTVPWHNLWQKWYLQQLQHTTENCICSLPINAIKTVRPLISLEIQAFSVSATVWPQSSKMLMRESWITEDSVQVYREPVLMNLPQYLTWLYFMTTIQYCTLIDSYRCKLVMAKTL